MQQCTHGRDRPLKEGHRQEYMKTISISSLLLFSVMQLLLLHLHFQHHLSLHMHPLTFQIHPAASIKDPLSDYTLEGTYTCTQEALGVVTSCNGVHSIHIYSIWAQMCIQLHTCTLAARCYQETPTKAAPPWSAHSRIPGFPDPESTIERSRKMIPMTELWCYAFTATHMCAQSCVIAQHHCVHMVLEVKLVLTPGSSAGSEEEDDDLIVKG